MDEKLYRRIKNFANGCVKKKPYRTVEAARAAAEKIFKERGVTLHCYRCPHCLNFHLTKNSLSNWDRRMF